MVKMVVQRRNWKPDISHYYVGLFLLFITKISSSWYSLGQKKIGSIFSWKGSLCCQDDFCKRDVRAWRDRGAVTGQKSCSRGCWDSAQISGLKLKRSLLPGVLAGMAHSSAPPQSLSWLKGATSPKILPYSPGSSQLRSLLWDQHNLYKRH